MNQTINEIISTISISGKETKKHIQVALKTVFPGVKFSFRTEYDQVNVYWTDGPINDDVIKVLNRFESYTRVLSHTDYERSTGYEWKGDMYVGARYLNAIRTFSDERKHIILDHLSGEGPYWSDLMVFERYEVERDLIRSGILEGVVPQHCPDLMRNDSPVVDERVKKKDPQQPVKSVPNNVIPLFPEKKMIENRVTTYFNSLLPEQKLKMKTLELMYGTEQVALILESCESIDELFAIVANDLYL